MAKRAAKKSSAKRTTARKGAPKRKTARAGAARKTAARKTAARKGAAKRTSARKAARKTARKTTRPAGSRKTPAAAQQAKQPSRLASAATAVRGAVAGAVSTVTDKLPWGSSKPDGLALLEQDHRRFEELLKQGEETTESARDKRRDLLNTITRELNLHESMEENVLYPALKAHPEARDIVLEGYQEHHVADKIVEELHTVATDDERWGAKFKVLKENIEHHIQEEEGQMFRTARGLFSQEQLQELGDKMRAIKRQA